MSHAAGGVLNLVEGVIVVLAPISQFDQLKLLVCVDVRIQKARTVIYDVLVCVVVPIRPIEGVSPHKLARVDDPIRPGKVV